MWVILCLVHVRRLSRPSWSVHFVDESETELARTTWPETHRPRGIMTEVSRKHANSSGPKANFKIKTCCIERVHSHGQHLCKFIGTQESVCIRKEYNSQRTGLGHEYGCHDVMWKHSIVAQLIAHKPVIVSSVYHFQYFWNFDLECKHGWHKTAFRARKVNGTFEKTASHGFT